MSKCIFNANKDNTKIVQIRFLGTVIVHYCYKILKNRQKYDRSVKHKRKHHLRETPCHNVSLGQVACNYMKVAATCTNFGKVAATDILLRVSYTEFVEMWLYF